MPVSGVTQGKGDGVDRASGLLRRNGALSARHEMRV